MMSSALYRWGRFAARRPWTVIGSWIVMAVLVLGASSAVGQELEESWTAPGLDSQKATDLLEASRSDRAGLTAQIVLTPLDDGATFFDSAEARRALTQVQADAAALPNVLSTSAPAEALSSDGRVALIRVQYPVLDELSVADLENLQELREQAGEDSPLRIELGGDLSFAFAEAETGIGELAGLIAAVIILLLAFGSLIAMGLPIAMALFGLVIGISSMSLITLLIDIPAWAPEVGTMVGLGVGIDYALFLVARHREYLSRGMSVEESVGRAVATAGQAVLFAGGTVVIAILGLAFAGVQFITAGGIGISVIVLIMVLASLTLVPAFLGMSGHWVNRLGVNRLGVNRLGVNRLGFRSRRTPRETAGGGWQRWGEHVSKRAGRYAVGGTVFLLAVAAPVLALEVGMPDEGSLPDQRTERRAYDLVADGFGPGVNGPLVIAVDISEDGGVVQPLRAAIGRDSGIASVGPAQVDAGGGVATMVAFPTTGPQDAGTLETVRRLRADVLPSVLDGSPARAHVGGQTASFADVADKVGDRLPVFIGAVILLSLVLLTMVFRSVVVPIKAALLNLLSIGSAFGVLVMVFQWGWGADLIGLETTVPIVPFIPMFMFAILFGLSMDYEVFLLSRVREEYLATGDNQASVIHGIAKTGRVITSAALIMISVFLGFVLSDDPTVKMFGLGLAVAIFIDATIVRMVLVPATMKLIGDANWWLPGWLDRLLPTVDVEGSGALPAGGPQLGHDLEQPGLLVPGQRDAELADQV
jgi:RND superfamily putative drug exporter